MHPSFTSRINLLPTGNRCITTRKPATESTRVQGMFFSEELSFSDQKCKSHPFSTFCTFCSNPRDNPRDAHLRDGNTHPGRYKTGTKPSGNLFKTPIKQGIPGYPLLGVKRRLRTLRSNNGEKQLKPSKTGHNPLLTLLFPAINPGSSLLGGLSEGGLSPLRPLSEVHICQPGWCTDGATRVYMPAVCTGGYLQTVHGRHIQG